jgi:hypothetical protein
MRVLGLLCTTLVVACLNPANSYAQQGSEQRRSADRSPLPPEEQSEPYHKHHDTRHGHDHFYPDRGAIVRDLPRGTIGTSYAGVSYRYHDGIWLEPRGPAFMVIAPPIGLVAPTLPLFSTVVTHGGETFLYSNDTYYRPRTDLGGYEVVNDPAEEAPQATPEALVGGLLPGAPAAAQASTATSAVLTPAVSVGSAGVAAPVTARALSASALPASVATQAASFPPPPSAPVTAPSASMTVAAVPITTATSGPAPIAPAAAGPASPEPQKGPKVFLYPKNGQTSDQQARDRYDCYRFAVAQSGFDPMRGTGAASPAPAGEQQSDYERAQSACFEARGYASR